MIKPHNQLPTRFLLPEQVTDMLFDFSDELTDLGDQQPNRFIARMAALGALRVTLDMTGNQTIAEWIKAAAERVGVNGVRCVGIRPG